jgi:hypothetical protein
MVKVRSKSRTRHWNVGQLYETWRESIHEESKTQTNTY